MTAACGGLISNHGAHLNPGKKLFNEPGPPHHHLAYRDSTGERRNPLDVLSHENFTFNESDPSSCEDEE